MPCMLRAGGHVHLPRALPMVAVTRKRTKTIPPWVHVSTRASCTLAPAHEHLFRTVLRQRHGAKLSAQTTPRQLQARAGQLVPHPSASSLAGVGF